MKTEDRLEAVDPPSCVFLSLFVLIRLIRVIRGASSRLRQTPLLPCHGPGVTGGAPWIAPPAVAVVGSGAASPSLFAASPTGVTGASGFLYHCSHTQIATPPAISSRLP